MMKVFRPFCACLIGLVIVATETFPTFAQRAGVETKVASLLSRTCTGNYVQKKIANVSIGRRLYPSRAYIDSGSASQPFLIVCKVNSKGSKKGFGTLRFTLGQQDNSTSVVLDVRFFLNGNLTSSYTFRSGELRTFLLDVSRVEDVAIEVYNNGYSVPLYVLEDVLEPMN